MKRFAFLFLLPVLVHATPVTRVIDGDTIVVGTTHIRLACIDAPEHNQAYGAQATRALQWTVGHEATLIPANRDRYGRTVARVFVDGVDINLAQVKAGNAWDYLKYCRDPEVAQAENDARAHSLGLWAYPHLEPWLFRKAERSKNK